MVKDFNAFHNRRSDRKIKHKIISKNLFDSEDEFWKKIRTIVTPTFTSGKMKKMYSMIDDCAKYAIDHLESHVIEKKEVKIKDVFSCLTMDVIAKCAFGTDINAHQDKYDPFVVNGLELFNVKNYKIILISLCPRFILKQLNINSFFNDENNEFFLNVARHIIKIRRGSNEKRNDFLQLLMDAKSSDTKDEGGKIDAESHYVDDDDDENGHKIGKHTLDNDNCFVQQLTDDEICAQAWIFFIAGYETTATTLSFCAYELALNHEIQNRLHKELKLAMNDDGEIDYDVLSKLPYLDAVVSETLRKYPPVQRLERTATQSYQIPTPAS